MVLGLIPKSFGCGIHVERLNSSKWHLQKKHWPNALPSKIKSLCLSNVPCPSIFLVPLQGHGKGGTCISFWGKPKLHSKWCRHAPAREVVRLPKYNICLLFLIWMVSEMVYIIKVIYLIKKIYIYDHVTTDMIMQRSVALQSLTLDSLEVWYGSFQRWIFR